MPEHSPSVPKVEGPYPGRIRNVWDILLPLPKASKIQNFILMWVVCVCVCMCHSWWISVFTLGSGTIPFCTQVTIFLAYEMPGIEPEWAISRLTLVLGSCGSWNLTNFKCSHTDTQIEYQVKHLLCIMPTRITFNTYMVTQELLVVNFQQRQEWPLSTMECSFLLKRSK